MRNITKYLLLVLCMCSIILSAASCKKSSGDSEGSNGTTQTGGNSGQESDTGTPYEDTVKGIDYGNSTFRILCSTELQGFYEDTHEIESIKKSVVDRNEKVQNLLNIELDYDAISGNTGNQTVFATTIRTSNYSGDNVYDLVIPQSYYGVALGLEGCYFNYMNSDSVRWDEPWYYQDVNDKCQIYGQTYFLASAFLMDKIQAAMVAWYNVGLGEQFGLSVDDLYQRVFDGEWTFEDLDELSRVVENNEGVYGAVSVWHGIRALLIAQDTPFVTVSDSGDVSLSYYNQHLESVFSRVYSFVNENPNVYAMDSGNEAVELFPQGQSLFALSYVGLMASSDYMNSDLDYTLLPMPKYDAEQENYITDVQRWDLVSVLSNADTERACVVLDALSYYSYTDVVPEFWDHLLGSRFARDPMVPDVLEIVRQSINIDFSAIYQTQMDAVYSGKNSITRLIFDRSNTLSSWWADKQIGLGDMLDSLLVQYYELSVAS